MDGIAILLFIIALYWLVPIVMVLVGLARIRSKPGSAKKLLITAGILLLIGIGVCGALLY